jgi:hypothetical protein
VDTAFQLQSIELQNYRRFEQFRCEFDPRFTLLMGENGRGKTSLLRAIFLGLGCFLESAGLAPAAISEGDVRRSLAIDPANESWRKAIYPARVTLGLSLDQSQIQISASRSATGETVDPWRKVAPGSGMVDGKVQGWFGQQRPSPIPLFARLGASLGSAAAKPTAGLLRVFEDRKDVWSKFHEDGVDAHALSAWFQYNELRSLQEGQPPLIYRLAKEAVLSGIHAGDVKFVVRDNQLMLRHEGQGWRPFDQLSDGQRRLASIFMELAMRAASLNSHLGENCIAETPGLVLIDELDLHLHPRWQREVIGDLLRAFPKMQFVVASHSPFLLQAAFEVGKVVDVSTGEFVEPGDASIEDIAEVVMGIDLPQRSRRFLEMKEKAQDFYDLMEHPAATPEAVAALKIGLDRAMAPFADDPAAAAWLEHRRAAAGL